MRDQFRFVGCVGIAALLIGCSGGDGNDFEPPVCAPSELALEGTVDGEPVNIRRVVDSGYAWINFPDNGDYENAYLNVTGDSGIEAILHIEWPRALARDQTTDAFGFVDISSQTSGALQVGNCADDGFVSILTAREDGADFLLRDLSAGPPCQGQPVDGELAGCLRF